MRIALIFIFLMLHVTHAQQYRSFHIQTIAFYNLENLFDYSDDPLTFDDDRTPEGKDHWTASHYHKKLKNMARVLSEIGKDLTGTPPALIGVCEVENRQVLEDLINEKSLLHADYGIIHFDSPDRRGVDVGLLYQRKIFVPTRYKAVELKLYQDQDPVNRIYTRDQLIVSGMFLGEPIHILINHWPSRSGGEARSRPKRIRAAELNKRIMDSLWSLDPYAKIIMMGDLNDDPISTSVKQVLRTQSSPREVKSKTLFNPMESMFKKGWGTLAWRDQWNLFDQILVSSEFLKEDYSSFRFYRAGIYNPPYLATPEGRYKGYPFRSVANGRFTGGYSDHFPVYIYLIRAIDH